MVKILILEDEDFTLRFLEKLGSGHPQVNGVIGVTRGQEAIKSASKSHPDIAFLDIELAPDDSFNGIETARAISEVSPETRFVFITGYAKYAVDSFTVHPYDYILKPIKIDKVMNTITALARETEPAGIKKTSNNRLIIRNSSGVFFVNVEDIYFIEKYGKKILIHNTNNICETSCSFSELKALLTQQFLRVHKSYIVNMDRIYRIKLAGNQSYEIYFYDYDQVAIMSRNKFRENQDKFAPSI